jgi:hypothetical protein
VNDAAAHGGDSPEEVLELLEATMGEADDVKVKRPKPTDDELRNPTAADVIGGPAMSDAEETTERLLHVQDEGPP